MSVTPMTPVSLDGKSDKKWWEISILGQNACQNVLEFKYCRESLMMLIIVDEFVSFALLFCSFLKQKKNEEK